MPTLAEMRALLRAGMTRDEFFTALDALLDRSGGLRLRGYGTDVVGVPVAEGGELLCFCKDALTYVEYNGGIFLEAT